MIYVMYWKSEQNFENFTVKGRFAKTAKKLSKIFNVLRREAVMTPQWLGLQIARNSLPTKLILYGMYSFHFYR